MKSFKNHLRTMAGGMLILTGMLLATTVVLADDMGGGMGDMNGMSGMSSGTGSAPASVGHGKGVREGSGSWRSPYRQPSAQRSVS